MFTMTVQHGVIRWLLPLSMTLSYAYGSTPTPAPTAAPTAAAATTSNASSDFIIIVCLSIGLMTGLYYLLKDVKSKDSAAMEEINTIGRKRAEKAGAFWRENQYSWDYVMVFGIRMEDEEVTDRYQSKYTLREILACLTKGGLETCLYYSVQRDEVYCKIRCKIERLLEEAERSGYRLLLEEKQLRSVCLYGRVGKWRSINITDEYNQCQYQAYQYIYTGYKDKHDVNHIYTKYGQGDESKQKILKGVDRLKLMYQIMVARSNEGGSHLDIVKLLKTKCILAFYPLHDMEELNRLRNKWLVYWQWPWNQPVDQVKDYFGEKIGLWFLWLGHYTTWLASASICGVLCWINVALKGNNPNVPGTAVFCGFVAVWSTLFTEFWKRKQSTYAMQWGTNGFEEEEQTRPQFQATMVIPDPVNGKPTDYFPAAEARKRLIFSTFIISCLILIVIGSVASIFILKDFLNKPEISSKINVAGINFASFIPSFANAIQIQIMNFMYGTIALKLNEYENHRTDTAFADNLIIKTFLFQFVNSYASLIYIAFVKPKDQCLVSCMNELSTNLGTIFLTRLVVKNVMAVLVPMLMHHKVLLEETAGIDPDKELSLAEKEYLLETYDVMLGPFTDYAEMAIQFGYATLFVAAYPLSCLMAFINNYIYIRVDAWKLLQMCRRPEPRSAEDIGTWASIIEIIGITSVITNSAVIAFTSTLFESVSNENRIWIFLVLEHGMFLFKYFVMLVVPDVPRSVEIQLARVEYICDKVVRDDPDDTDDELLTEERGLMSDNTITAQDDDW